jgi:hypothetical protein
VAFDTPLERFWEFVNLSGKNAAVLGQGGESRTKRRRLVVLWRRSASDHGGESRAAAGIILETGGGVTIQLPPPALPERMPGPCARCGCMEGVALYATSRVRYFGCANCRHLTVVTAGAAVDNATTVDAAPPDGHGGQARKPRA